MSKYARVLNGVAVEIFTPPANTLISDCFCPEIVNQFIACPVSVVVGSVVDSNGKWAIIAESVPEPVAPTYPKVDPITFQLLFTAQERVDADALRTSDPYIKDFWKLLDDPRTATIDLNLESVRGAVEYTLTKLSVDVPVRLAEILTGVPK